VWGGVALLVALGGGGTVSCSPGEDDAVAHSRHAITHSGAGSFAALDVGGGHGCVVRADGEVFCWGQNDFLQARPKAQGDFTGINSTDRQDALSLLGATRVDLAGHPQGSPTRAVEVSTGGAFSCVRISDGSVQCWGANQQRQAANAAVDEFPRANVRNLTVGATEHRARQLSVGHQHGCVVTQLGTVICWGSNSRQQLGRPTFGNQVLYEVESAPPTGGQTFGPKLDRVVSVASGREHTCALRDDGSVWCWGAWKGNADPAQDARDADPVPGLAGVIEIAAGNGFTCALLAQGDVVCWGRNNVGQCGRGHTDAVVNLMSGEVTLAPVSGLASVRSIAVGEDHACAVRTNGNEHCWGGNSDSQTGDPNAGAILTSPGAAVAGGDGRIVSTSAGDRFTCALRHMSGGSDGTITCWGRNDHGQFGNGSTSASTPLAHFAFTPDFQCGSSELVWSSFHNGPIIASGEGHTCAVVDMANCWNAGLAFRERGVVCWGRNSEGQCGFGYTSTTHSPRRIGSLGFSSLPGEVIALTAGQHHTCALMSDGAVRCWGLNDRGQLGDGTTTTRSGPVSVTGLAGPVRSIVAGAKFTCALLADSRVQCWGNNQSGELGSLSPPGPWNSSGFTNSFSMTPQFVCAQNHAIPVEAGNLTHMLDDFSTNGCNLFRATQISAGTDHVCARIADGTVRCWGRNFGATTVGGDGSPARYGVLGTVWSPPGNESDPQFIPFAGEVLLWTQSAVGRVVSVSSHEHGNCVVRADGSVTCWGSNENLRTGVSGTPTTPQQQRLVALTRTAVALSGGYRTKCAVLDNGHVWCWGANGGSQAGGTMVDVLPLRISVGSSAFGPVHAVGVGWNQSCGMSSDGNVWCWGQNDFANLGRSGTGSATPTPDIWHFPQS
jgi:alpha-tubulin suppressor-like RCC1 family protein